MITDIGGTGEMILTVAGSTRPVSSQCFCSCGLHATWNRNCGVA